MKIINFLLYGNFFIALCAYAQTLQTYHLVRQDIYPLSILPLFIASATFFLYNIHKPITYFLKKQFSDNQRFLHTKTFSIPLSIFTVIAALVCFFNFFLLKKQTQISLLVAAVFSLSYVIPIYKGLRLRDFPFVKIFLIAFVWSFVTVILPIQELGKDRNISVLLMFLEKVFFIFALTIPFDIRDIDWDAKTQVKTIPLSIGIRNAKYLAIGSLVISSIIVWILNTMTIYTVRELQFLFLSYFFSILVVIFTEKTRNDYFFYGLTDGMMLAQSLVLLFHCS